MKRFAVDFFIKHGCRLFLIDLTHAEVIGGTMLTFSAANPRGELAKSLRKVIAAFVPRKLAKEDRFLETVAVNRGFQVGASDSLEKAVEWLKQGK